MHDSLGAILVMDNYQATVYRIVGDYVFTRNLLAFCCRGYSNHI